MRDRPCSRERHPLPLSALLRQGEKARAGGEHRRHGERGEDSPPRPLQIALCVRGSAAVGAFEVAAADAGRWDTRDARPHLGRIHHVHAVVSLRRWQSILLST